MDIEQVSNKTQTFYQHVLSFDDKSKSNLMNMLQYSILAVIPIVILNKIAKTYVPEADDTKGSLEITFEIVAQISFIFIGMFFIHRLVTFVPTYSNEDYGDINMITIIISFLMIVLSLQTKLGEKVDILANRIIQLWNGETETTTTAIKNKSSQQQNIMVKQPIQRTGNDVPFNYNLREQQNTTYNNNMTSINNLPIIPGESSSMYNSSFNQPSMMQQPQQNQPNFDAMYQEPMAANDSLGGGFSLF